jgi:hypothetical protein
VHQMGAMWEPDGAIWEANDTIWALHGSQMGAIWEWCVLHGSHVCHMGAGWSHTEDVYRHIGAPCTQCDCLSHAGAKCTTQGHMGAV